MLDKVINKNDFSVLIFKSIEYTIKSINLQNNINNHYTDNTEKWVLGGFRVVIKIFEMQLSFSLNDIAYSIGNHLKV